MNNKVYYIKAEVQLAKVGKVAITKEISMPSNYTTADGVQNSSVDRAYIKNYLKAKDFKVTKVELISEL